MRMNNTRILYKDTLLYRGVLLISVDRTYDAIYWCNRHGLTYKETVETEKDGKFDIWSDEKGHSCAIPV